LFDHGQANQKVLGGPSADAATLLIQEAFEQGQEGEKLLGCSPLEEEAKIRNHTCVLAPEVTQGQFSPSNGRVDRAPLC
jgi:hypothetical protein